MNEDLLDGADAAIEAAYRAAAGTGTWADALGRVERALGLRAAWFVELDPLDGTFLGGRFSGRVAHDAQHAYAREHPNAGPLLGPLDSLAPLVWQRDDEAFESEFIATHPFFRRVLAAVGASRAAAICLLDTPSRRIVLLAAADVPVPRDELRPDAARIALHLQRALGLESRLRERSDAQRDWPGVLDRFTRPMMLVAADRAVLYANGAARAQLESSGTLTVADGRLQLRSESAERQFVEAIARLQRLDGTRPPDRPPARSFVQVSVEADGTPVGLHLMPQARSGEAPAAFWVVLHGPRASRAPSADEVRAIYGFPPAEARVCAGLARGRTLAEIAREHGISLNTARTQIRSAMRRAGVSRQIDLVRRLMTAHGAHP